MNYAACVVFTFERERVKVLNSKKMKKKSLSAFLK